MIETGKRGAHADRGALPIALRAVLVANVLAVVFGLAVKFIDAARLDDPRFGTAAARLANEFTYFTIDSNLLVLVTCVALLIGGRPRLRAEGLPRLIGVVSITVTGIVYYALLAADAHYVGVAKVADALVHLVSPLLYVGGWLGFGPHGRLRSRDALLMLVFPMAWVLFTLVRGAMIDWYPYDFIDVGLNGYAAVATTIAGLSAGAVALAAAAAAVRLDRRRATRPVVAGSEAVPPASTLS